MKKRKVTQSIVIFTLLLVPALYALIFLGAYWDPVSNMSNVPVVVVNSDQGYTVNGGKINIGNTVVDNLKTNDKVKWIFTNEKDADEGVLSQKYYAELIIPKDFTEKVSSVSGETKTQGILYFKSNDKKGMMASSLLTSVSSSIETSISQSISENIVDSIISQLQELPSNMQNLSDALDKLDKGSKQLQEGVLTLSKGQTAFNSGLDTLTAGLGNANQGGSTMKDSLKKLSDNSILFANGINDNVTSLNEYLASSNKQLQNSISMLTLLKNYIAEHPESANDANIQAIIKALNASNTQQTKMLDASEVSKTLSNALDKLNETYDVINKSAQQIPGGMKKAANSAEALSKALGQVSSGSTSLSVGLNSATQGANTLNQKSKSILDGENKINEGFTQLISGIELVKSSVDSSILQLSDSASSMQGLGKFVAQPVKIESTKIGEAKNTGTALSPFMISLCLYIGGMMIMISIFCMDNVKFKETKIAQKIKIDLGIFRYQLIGIAQAILIAFVVHTLLGLTVQNTAQFYAICILGSLAFTTLIQVLVMLFKSFGKLLCLLFMMCQLTAGGGVLPTEILPDFYKSIHPYMPMTYSINALRNVILSIEPDSYHYNIAVLILITFISALIVVLLSFLEHRRGKMQEVKMQPLAE